MQMSVASGLPVWLVLLQIERPLVTLSEWLPAVKVTSMVVEPPAGISLFISTDLAERHPSHPPDSFLMVSAWLPEFLTVVVNLSTFWSRERFFTTALAS